MIRVLHVLSALHRHGTETFVMNLFREIDREEIMFDFLVFNSNTDGYYDEIISMGSKIFQLPPRRAGLKDYEESLDKFFKENAGNYDAVHFHAMSLTTLSPLKYAKKYGIKKRLMHMHGMSCQGFHNKVLHFINKSRISGLATDFLGCSSKAVEWGYGGTKAMKSSKVVFNGIDIDKFRFKSEVRKKIRKELGIDDKFVCIHIGTFNEIKNHRFLLDVFKELNLKHSQSILICIGNGSLFNQSKGYALELGIAEKVLFLGERANVCDYLQASDAMIFPSLHEGLGIALIEAQIAGLPVVASTGVPKEANVTGNFNRLSLNESTCHWVDKILEIKNNVTRDLNLDVDKFSSRHTLHIISGLYKG